MSKDRNINEAIIYGRRAYRKAIECAKELVKLEGYDMDDWEADVLWEVIMNDPPRQHIDALKEIRDKWSPTLGEGCADSND